MTRSVFDGFTGAALGTILCFPAGAAAQPLPARRQPPPLLALGTRVLARPHSGITAYGTVVGVAHAAPPRYDVQLDNGCCFGDLAAAQLEAL
jgi:hypothetical protein